MPRAASAPRKPGTAMGNGSSGRAERERARYNGADGISDVEGKVARVAMSELGNERISMLLAADLNRVNGMSDPAAAGPRG